MTKTEFRAQFITQFLASWTASHYDEACLRNEHRKLESPPCEDASYLADKVWAELSQIGVVAAGRLN